MTNLLTMDLRKFENTYMWILSAVYLVLCIQDVRGQSCGPRVSARLLAEIPCDMSKSSYCSAPGSAYPWNSVKRYINDNQGLVRRMYGDEKHSSVLLNEIDGIRLKFEQLRSYISRGYSRTEYGRSARGSRRQPRPQIFDDDDDETPATIFRVVTETSIKVGDPVTRPMTTESVSTTYESTTVDYDSTTLENTLHTATVTTSESSTTQQVVYTDPSTTETERDSVLTTAKTTQTTTASSTTVTTPQPTTSTMQDIPVAMERIGHDDRDDYDYEPDRKAAASVHQNSVEEKIKYKQEASSVKRNDPPKYDDEASMYVVVADASTEEPVSNDTETKSEEEETTEEIPRRGINACPVKNEVIAPYWANNTRGETLALLNVHPFEQYVHFEKCAFENHQMLCREGCRCEQQYRLHRLLAFDPKNECRGIFSDWFRFPSCCVCICYDITPDIPRTRSRKGRMK